MNYKSILSSWLGLGLLMAILQYPMQYFFTLLDMTKMHSLAVGLAGWISASLFTYYFYPRIMSPRFKIYAMATAICISLTITLIVFLSNSELRSAFVQILFEGSDTRQIIMVVAFVILGLLFQLGIWYLFITFGNRYMVKVLEAQAKK